MSFSTSIDHSIKFPDTPQARRVAQVLTAQAARRATTQRALFSSPAGHATRASAQIYNFTSPTSSTSENIDGPTVEPTVRSEISVPPTYSFDDQLPPDTDLLNSLSIDSMITGSSSSNNYTSGEIFSNLMALAVVPTAVAALKTVKVAAVPGFVLKVFANGTAIQIKDLDLAGHQLRAAIRRLTTALQIEYKTTDHPIFVAQLLLQSLSLSRHAVKILPQLHRYLSIEDGSDVQQFEDDCATGTPAPIDINFRKPLVQLPGFARLQEEPDEWKRMTTALIDYAASMTNSDYQEAYNASKDLLFSLRLRDFASVAEFGDAEEQAFAVFDAYAQDARRSTVDCLDRGLLMLKNLSTDQRREIDTYARKKKIPENVMVVHWVISHLVVLEKRDQPQYSFWTNKSPAPDAPTDHALLPLSLTNQQDSGEDSVTITCQLALDPLCEKTFTTSPSYWLAKKDELGIPFQLPKSCKPCRALKRKNWNLHRHGPPAGHSTANLTVSVDIGPDEEVDPDDDFAMADYASRFLDF